MGNERGRHREGHAAQVALVRPLAGVAPLVIGQRARLGERLTADVAHVRLLAAVQPDEDAQVLNVYTEFKVAANRVKHLTTSRSIKPK